MPVWPSAADAVDDLARLAAKSKGLLVAVSPVLDDLD